MGTPTGHQRGKAKAIDGEGQKATDNQLAGSDDTSYKEAVLNLMSSSFQWEATVPAGTLELVHEDGTVVHCSLVLMSEWRARLPKLMRSEL